MTSSQKISNVKCYLFEDLPLNNNLVNICDVRGRGGAPNGNPVLCADGHDPIDINKKLKCTVSRSLVLKWHSRFIDAWTDSAQCGQKPYMNVGKVKATKDVIATM